MATKAFHIRLNVSGIDSNERMQALTDAVRAAGRQLHAAATLICPDSTPPEIELLAEDLAEGRQPILMEDGA